MSSNQHCKSTEVEKCITFHGHAHPKLTRIFQPCFDHYSLLVTFGQGCQASHQNASLQLILNLSLHFNGHFPGEPGLASVYWSKGWWRWWWQLDYRSYKSCKAPVKSSPPRNQHPVFLQAGALPVAQPTASKHWREKDHIPWPCLPQAHLGSSNFVSDH